MSDTPLETLAFEQLQNDADCKHCADEWIGEYNLARSAVYKLLNQAVPAAEPNLTDHSEKHVQDVFRTAYELLGKSLCPPLSPSDVMGLVCTILYHDVGNVTGRQDHQGKIVEIFNDTWPKSVAERRRLRQIVMKAGGAHAGKAVDGSQNTLKDVPLEESGPFGEKICLRDIATVTRFADELAEGPQRTNRYMRTHNLISKDSQIYHDYSDITNVRIDRGNGRIVLTYDIDVESTDDDKLIKLLEMAYSRIWKLNWERQLARHYCDPLSCFKQTEATFNFIDNGIPLQLELPPIVLNDVGPSSTSPIKAFTNLFEHYKICQLVRDIKESRKESK